MKRLKPPKAIVFDMDGVLIDSERIWEDVETDYLMDIAPGYTREHQQDIIGKRLRDLHQFLVDRFGTTVSFESFESHFHEMGDDVYRNKVPLMPAVTETLQALHDQNIQIGLASSSPLNWIDITLERFELKPFFNIVVSGDQVPKGKPAPDIYQAAAKHLKRYPKDCWAVEDSTVGIQSAQSAGMTVIGYRNGHNTEQSFDQADCIINHLDLLTDLYN